ncbi:YybH family protein [Mesorhizobium sp. 10J20-29]
MATPTVEDLLAQWIEAFDRHDLDRHMALYAEDATLFGSVDELKVGRDAIRAYFAGRAPDVREESYPMPQVRMLTADVAVTAGFVDFAEGDTQAPTA